MTSLDLPALRPRALDDTLALPRVAGTLYAGLVAIMAAPAALWPIPRANDIVDHWARLTLYHLAPDDPLRALYHIHLGLIPNLGIDLLYLALSPIVSAQAAARLALVLAIALPALGAWALHRALFEKPSPTIWLIPFLSYNVATTTGLLNFSLGMGLAFLGLAYVIRRGERLTAGDYIGLNLLGAALFFCHLIAWAAFAGLLGLVRVENLRGAFIRRGLTAVIAQALPLALLALSEAPPAHYVLTGSKFAVILAPVLSKTNWDIYALTFLLCISTLAFIRGLSFAPQTRLALAVFFVLAHLAPSAHGAGTLIDARLVAYAWYFAIATTSLTDASGLRVGAALAAVAMTALRLFSVTPAWEAFQQRAEVVREGLAVLPAGARALVVAPMSSGCGDSDLTMAQNLTVFAVIDRHAYVNTLFAQTGIQPVAPADPSLDGGPTLGMDPRWLTPEGQAQFAPPVLAQPWAEPFLHWRQHFTHVIDAHGLCPPDAPPPGLTRIGGAAGLDIYRID